VRWYETCPERLDFELRALTNAGFAYEVDEAQRQAGRLELLVNCPIGGTQHPLKVVFPADYPFFPFQVFAPTLNLARHQDPYSKVLCFVARIQTEWDTTDTVAKYLTDQLPQVLRANEAGAADVLEAVEGAPVVGFMQFEPGSLVITQGWSLPADVDRGRIVLGIETGTNANELFRGAVLEVQDLRGAVLSKSAIQIGDRYSQRLMGRWLRIASRPRASKPLEVLEELCAKWPELRRPAFAGGPDVTGIVFQDEARFKELHDIWLFLVRRRDRDVAKRGRKRLPAGDQITVYLAFPDRGGVEDLQIRVPRLKPLINKAAAIFGLGALGSAVAGQLGRAGLGRLALVDWDTVQLGNIPRWQFGWPAAGHLKPLALGSYITYSYPYVKTVPVVLRVGATTEADLHEKLMAEALDGANAIVDCTVELTIHHYLSSLAWQRAIPYIWASGTTGGWGGIIGRTIPGHTTGCWKCFKHHQLDNAYPVPAAEEGPDIQPVGCFSPTFTGAGFDMDLISTMASRLVTATLCRGDKDAYPDFDWDIGIADFWRNGRPVAPHWQTFALDRHPSCDMHAQ
jgi:molybdopterin/thiamine biosynthesis adenylyltransferase